MRNPIDANPIILTPFTLANVIGHPAAPGEPDFDSRLVDVGCAGLFCILHSRCATSGADGKHQSTSQHNDRRYKDEPMPVLQAEGGLSQCLTGIITWNHATLRQSLDAQYPVTVLVTGESIDAIVSDPRESQDQSN